ncbi:hypothetical protein Taro_053436 [Colocasia esculenta]|uniref:Uncharacterized protein n=1 Tax=Colocasia esculenta TaxID=4460 RepID=A0A843XN61_COLES|nr:hypothetical protein [Colocasia esculenta]
MWLLGVSRDDTWLFLPNLVEVRDVGACVVRLWSHVVASVSRELLCLSGCVPRVASALSRVGPDSGCGSWRYSVPRLCSSLQQSSFASALLEFLLFWLRLAVTGVCCRTVVVAACSPCVTSSVSCEHEHLYRELRVAFLQVLGVASFPAGSECELHESVVAVAGCACFEHGCCFALAVAGFVFGLRIRVGVSRRLREPTLCPCWISPLLLGYVLCWLCVWPCVPLHHCALCSAQSASLLELSRCLVCRIAPLVERYDTCLWLLPALCWLVVNSGEVFSEFFSVGSGGGEASPELCCAHFCVALWVELVWVSEVVEALFQCGPASPSHCLALRWFRSHVGRLGVGLQLGQAAVVVVVLCCDSLASLYRGGSRQESMAGELEEWTVCPPLSCLWWWLVCSCVTVFLTLFSRLGFSSPKPARWL